MAWSAAIAALPTVIESISKIMTNINDLSNKTLTPKADLQKQNKQLGKALEDLKDSIQKIGISIRNYESIYRVAIQEETAAKALMTTFSVWKDGKLGADDRSIENGLDNLRDLNSALEVVLDANKREIEAEDRDDIDGLRSDISDVFNRAEDHLKASTEQSYFEAYDDVKQLFRKLGKISSILNARFKDISTKLIKTSVSKTEK